MFALPLPGHFRFVLQGFYIVADRLQFRLELIQARQDVHQTVVIDNALDPGQAGVDVVDLLIDRNRSVGGKGGAARCKYRSAHQAARPLSQGHFDKHPIP